jgi:hemophore-related protein
MRIATKAIIASCGVAAALAAGTGVAAAAPNDAIANTTCTYPQIIAAVNAQDPAVGQQITSNPVAVGYLQQFVASSPDQRRNLIAQAQAVPAITAQMGLINNVAGTCNNF